jgi:hypothetical protein
VDGAAADGVPADRLERDEHAEEVVAEQHACRERGRVAREHV